MNAPDFHCTECDGNNHHAADCPKRIIAAIRIERVEGWIEHQPKFTVMPAGIGRLQVMATPTQLGYEPRGATAMEAAENWLLFQASTAPDDGSYHKCDVMVEFNDGLKHGLQFDLKRDFALGDLLCDLRSDAGFHSGGWRPPHITEAAHQMIVEQMVKPQRRTVLADLFARYT